MTVVPFVMMVQFTTLGSGDDDESEPPQGLMEGGGVRAWHEPKGAVSNGALRCQSWTRGQQGFVEERENGAIDQQTR